MRQVKNRLFVFMIFFLLTSLSAFAQVEADDDTQIENSWSSVDNVFLNRDQDILVKKPISGPIKIGFSAKEVREVMGIPDRMDEEKRIYYYRTSPIYFNHDWKVQSWDNRYGNLKVADEVVTIRSGSHISEVFKEMGFPLRLKKIDHGYQLEYPDEVIYLNKNWLVVAVRLPYPILFCSERVTMSPEDFLEEFNHFLVEKKSLIQE